MQMCPESTGHAKAAQKTHDPLQVEYGKLVDLLYSSRISTATTATPNRDGNDVNTQKSSSR
jgi:peptide methionine sulfoxide reductase MsrA